MFLPEIKPGAIVHHKKFGAGKVLARYGEDELSKIIVKFQEEGEKKLAVKYAKLEVDMPDEPVAPAEVPVIDPKILAVDDLGKPEVEDFKSKGKKKAAEEEEEDEEEEEEDEEEEDEEE